jgi:hypothetical protein
VKILSKLSIGLFLTVIFLCLSASFRFVNLQSTVTLIIFNVFFVSLFFQLYGSLSMKVAILSVGNLLGFFWNLFFHDFSLAGYASFGVTFNAFFTILYPILNLMWIVPFWSLSLSFLPKPQSQKTSGVKL